MKLTLRLGVVTVACDGTRGRNDKTRARAQQPDSRPAEEAKQSLTQHKHHTEYGIEAEAAWTSTADLPSPAVTG